MGMMNSNTEHQIPEGLTFDGETYTAITPEAALKLILDSLAQACDAMANRYCHEANRHYFSDDDTDYMRAIGDQISTLADLRCCDTDEEMTGGLLKILNYRRPAADQWLDEGCEAFIYGYADHHTDISDLVLENERG